MPAVTLAERCAPLSGLLLALVLAAPGARAPWPAAPMALLALAATGIAAWRTWRRRTQAALPLQFVRAAQGGAGGGAGARRLAGSLVLVVGAAGPRRRNVWLWAADLRPGALRRLRVALECGAVPRPPR